jgi:hypothetical protein
MGWIGFHTFVSMFHKRIQSVSLIGFLAKVYIIPRSRHVKFESVNGWGGSESRTRLSSPCNYFMCYVEYLAKYTFGLTRNHLTSIWHRSHILFFSQRLTHLTWIHSAEYWISRRRRRAPAYHHCERIIRTCAVRRAGQRECDKLQVELGSLEGIRSTTSYMKYTRIEIHGNYKTRSNLFPKEWGKGI